MSGHDRFLRAPQLLLILLVCLVVGALEVGLLRTYVQMRATSEAYARDALIPLDLANVQRETLLLGREGEELLRGEGLDADAIRLRVSLLENQIRVTRAAATGRRDTTAVLDRLDRQAKRYTALLLGRPRGGGMPIEAVNRRLDRLFARMEIDIKQLYDREQNRSAVKTAKNLAVQRQTGLLLLVISGVLVVLAGALALSLRRRLGGTLARLASYTELNPAPLIKLASDGSIEFRNRSAERLARALTGGAHESLLPGDRAAIVARTLASGEREQHVHPVGERTLAWSFFPIASQAAVHCYGEDVTERRALEEQFRQAQKMEAVGQLAGGVAHDFNNMMSAVIGFSELVLNRLEPEHPVRGEIEEIRRAGERASEMTHQLLAFSRKQVLQTTVLDLNAVVADAEKLLRRLVGEDVDLVSVLEPELAPVEADSGQLQQVLMNLAVNARDAMALGGKLTIETENVELDEDYAARHLDVEPGRYVLLAVSDTGVGMDAATKARIFEPFFTTKGTGEGTGLGLATVYGIVKQSGGEIGVYSEPGRGTTFKIYLPQALAPAHGIAADLAREQPPPGSEAILLVEDEELVRNLGRQALEERGYTVLEAASGGHALEVARQHDGGIDLLVTDVVMPGLSGRELAERLAPLRPETKVLYTSGYTDDAIVRHGVLEPGIAFLPKPLTPSSLAHKVREVLDSPNGHGRAPTNGDRSGAPRSPAKPGPASEAHGTLGVNPWTGFADRRSGST